MADSQLQFGPRHPLEAVYTGWGPICCTQLLSSATGSLVRPCARLGPFARLRCFTQGGVLRMLPGHVASRAHRPMTSGPLQPTVIARGGERPPFSLHSLFQSLGPETHVPWSVWLFNRDGLMSTMLVSPPVSLPLSWLPLQKGSGVSQPRTSILVQGWASGPGSSRSLCFPTAEATHTGSLSSATSPLFTVAPGFGEGCPTVLM